jgi:predicted DCC family thiol-disulfide oxidoreductase YuxK
MKNMEILPDAASREHPIIVFDGTCVLCSANAQFVLRHDRRGTFRLAAMQGDVGAALYRRFGIDPADPETLIVVTGQEALRDSDAVLVIWSGLGWPWKALSAFRIVPRGLRDPLYRWIARNRYSLFGRRSECWAPAPDYRDRLL